MYLTNCWYAVGWAEEFGDRLVERQVCGEKLALFRKPDGRVAAIHGICPHRFASLAKGKIIGHEAVECPYHGIRFDSSGVCVHNPHGIIPPAARVRSYRAVERHSLLWLWWGNSEEADESLIPDFSCLTSAKYRTLHGTIVTHAHYELVTDNLMDLSHVAFVHAGGIGGDSIQRGEDPQDIVEPARLTGAVVARHSLPGVAMAIDLAGEDPSAGIDASAFIGQ